MAAHDIIMAAGGAAGADKLYVDDVFSTYLYTGNGSTQTINNGIDLAGKGGLVWVKSRTDTEWNYLEDTVGHGRQLSTNYTDSFGDGAISNNSNGFSLTSYVGVNGTGRNFASWTFRKAAKFFDCVTWTGGAVYDQLYSHSLGTTPGLVIVKKTSGTSNWGVWHRKSGASVSVNGLSLNSTAAALTPNASMSDVMTASVFCPGRIVDSSGNYFNENGSTYVAYLFAHDATTDGIIQCGSLSGSRTVTLGWEPQFVLMKSVGSSGSGVGDWYLTDVMRGMPNGSASQDLKANVSSAEVTQGYDIYPNPTGFYAPNSATDSIYLAIRRPNKPPTSGTQVFSAIARAGTGANATVTGAGFVPDLAMISARDNGSAVDKAIVSNRLAGYGFLRTVGTNAEVQSTAMIQSAGWANQDGIGVGNNSTVNASGINYINHLFRRAPAVFDVVCYTGDGSLDRSVQHGVGSSPGLTICKARSTTSDWWVSYGVSGTRWSLKLNDPAWLYANQVFEADASYFPVRQNGPFAYNATGTTYVAYLFATKAGVSFVGSFTGNGSSQTINCGFSAGARFVLIKKTSGTGSWLVGDSTRGLVAGNDPYLALNSTAAEVAGEDWLDPHSSGFIVNQTTADANASGATYIVLAFA